ncbi:MAG TPA: AP2 domain-containing protein [Leptolyngbyaceae cyanobacterium M33_DOE_097]|nr:AP2 domain-containing protein [Leptolyngbyaceae cyanobacterium M33_DOE_097]
MGISRIEQPQKKNFGYYVRLTRQGQQTAKFFSDKQYGGKSKALKAAEQYLQTLTQQLPPKSQAGRLTVRNTTGIVGVNRTRSTSRGHTYDYWQASWGSGSERKSMKFAVNKYGEKKAQELAIAARQRWEEATTLTITQQSLARLLFQLQLGIVDAARAEALTTDEKALLLAQVATLAQVPKAKTAASRQALTEQAKLIFLPFFQSHTPPTDYLQNIEAIWSKVLEYFNTQPTT